MLGTERGADLGTDERIQWNRLQATTPDDGGAPDTGPKKKAPLWQRLLPWVITILCFRLPLQPDRQPDAGRRDRAQLPGQHLRLGELDRLAGIMIPYSFLYLLIDTAVLWRVIRWFNANIPYKDLLPVRASTYIISILNEQVGKGAMALYLNRRVRACPAGKWARACCSSCSASFSTCSPGR